MSEEREIKLIEVDLELDVNTREQLKWLGLEMIISDDPEHLIKYAAERIITEAVRKMEKNDT